MNRALRAYSLESTRPPSATDAASELVARHAALVRRVVRRVFRRLPEHSGVEEDDLMSAAIIGLLEANQRYDARSEQDFEAFAEFRIKGAVLDELRRRDFMTRRQRAKANGVKRAETSLRERLGREPLDGEVAQELGLSEDDLRRVRESAQPVAYVDAEDPALALEGATPPPEAAVANVQLRGRLLEALKELPEREQLVLDLYFNQDLNLSEIGQILKLSVGRISQIKTAALAVLRRRLAEAAGRLESLAG
jgi:RNA polymerase sigma factor for flagellar operon FliA